MVVPEATDPQYESLLRNGVILQSATSWCLTSYGKSCERCKTYFVSPEFEERVCPWCRRIETGTLSPDMLVEVDVL